jgi:hypothetical protein
MHRRLARAGLRPIQVMIVGIAAELLPVAIFDELAHRELPALLRAGAQTRKLFRIHAEAARHFDLPSVEPADLLRVAPRFLVVRSTLRRHAAFHNRHWELE